MPLKKIKHFFLKENCTKKSKPGHMVGNWEPEVQVKVSEVLRALIILRYWYNGL
jgi:hypothetical protein